MGGKTRVYASMKSQNEVVEQLKFEKRLESVYMRLVNKNEQSSEKQEPRRSYLGCEEGFQNRMTKSSISPPFIYTRLQPGKRLKNQQLAGFACR
jgi:nicotinamide mononucleotide adenylyltransferase